MDFERIKAMEPFWGSWYIKRKLGEGGYGAVYEIERDDFGSKFKAAMKVMSIPQNESDLKDVLSDGMTQEETTSYFEGIVKEMTREFVLMESVKGHTNIVDYADHMIVKREDTIGWDIFIRMELLIPLNDYMIDNDLTEEDICNIGIDMCNALEVCERKNIIHRDIKPANIFMTNRGEYKLGDFGIARVSEKTKGASTMIGTKNFVAPEVYKGEKYGHTVDLYSLGIVLYQLLNHGRRPFYPPYPEKIGFEDKETAFSRRIMGEAIPLPDCENQDLARLVVKACSYKPEDRFANAAEMRAALEGVLHEISSGSKPLSDTNKKVADFTDKENEVKEPSLKSEIENREDVNSSDIIKVSDASKTVETDTISDGLNASYESTATAATNLSDDSISMTAGFSEEPGSFFEASPSPAPVKHEPYKEKSGNNMIKWIAIAATVIIAVIAIAYYPVSRSVKYNNAGTALVNGHYDTAYNLYTDLGNYKDSSSKATQTLYAKATDQEKQGKYKEAANTYSRIAAYKDSEDKEKYCRNMAVYKSAEQYYNDKDYDNARKLYESLGDFENASKMYWVSSGEMAKQAMKSGNYERAYDMLKKIPEEYMDDSEDLLNQAKYGYAPICRDKRDFANAIRLYEELGDYKDSKECLKETLYIQAKDMISQNSYITAIETLDRLYKLGEYKDTLNLKRESEYLYVKSHYDNTNKRTYEYLKELADGGYKDSGSLYFSLYKWKIDVIAINNSENSTQNMDSVSKTDTVYFHYRVSGGTPEGSESFTAKCKLPACSAGTYEFDAESGDEGWVNMYYLSGPIAGTGSIVFYDSSGNKVGAATINMK